MLRKDFVKCVFSRITAAILIAGLVGACSPQPDAAQEAGSVRVLAPLSNSKGSYSLDIFELKGIEDLQTMTGRFVRFFMSPRIVDNHLEGPAPKTRFIRNSDGDYIPGNEMTQQLVTLYAHMQKLALLDEELGAGGINSWPRDVGVAVRAKGGVSNNAFYDGATDSMLFVPYTQDGLPIAINGGILAHEHFHSLFYKTVLNDGTAEIHSRKDFLNRILMEDLSARERKLLPVATEAELTDEQMHFYYHLAFTRGLNEGLADFWGWMYTGDPDFIAQSLPSEKSFRSLKVKDESSVNSLPSEDVIKRALKVYYSTGNKQRFVDYVTGYAYSLGTQFSRVLKRYTDIYAQAHGVEPLIARKDVAKVIVKVLPQLKEDFLAVGNKYYASTDFVSAVIAKIQATQDMKEEECQFLSEVLNNSKSDSSAKYACKKDSRWSIETVIETTTPSANEGSAK